MGPKERDIESIKNSFQLIDILHYILLLWEKSKKDEMIEVLQETGYGKSEAFYSVAQAISECLPNESKEKKLLEGFLVGKERLRNEIEKSEWGLFY